MPLLYEPNADEDSFELTPDYNQLLVEWELEHPDIPTPAFSKEECVPFKFVWPGTEPKLGPLEKRRELARRKNGQFAKKG